MFDGSKKCFLAKQDQRKAINEINMLKEGYFLLKKELKGLEIRILNSAGIEKKNNALMWTERFS